MVDSHQPVTVFWFRRDLRLHDNTGLYHALRSGKPVVPMFVFDRNILDSIQDEGDGRVHFIHQELESIREELEKLGSSLWVGYGKPDEVFREMLQQFNVAEVYMNRDYEPYAQEREAKVDQVLQAHGAAMKTFKDHVIFEKNEVVKGDGQPYVIYSPYSKQWEKQFTEDDVAPAPSEELKAHFAPLPHYELPTLEQMGFKPTSVPFPSREVKDEVIYNYEETRNIPAQNGTSRLSVHLRNGTISIRQLVKYARERSHAFLNELIWRDFYQMILWQFPRVVHESFRKEYDNIPWRNDEAEFQKWCEGNTGYPIVDAGMRQLNTIGYMHNRLRMITASFLTKHLLIDWRWGEAYFGQKLLDYELGSNNGGWQWAAGSGVDAAPYFRIFNPARQVERFDPQYKFIRHWVPEYGTPNYPKPVVEHKFARERALSTYKQALSEAQ